MGAGSTSAVKINEGKEVGEAAIKAINLVGAERAMKVGWDCASTFAELLVGH